MVDGRVTGGRLGVKGTLWQYTRRRGETTMALIRAGPDAILHPPSSILCSFRTVR